MNKILQRTKSVLIIGICFALLQETNSQGPITPTDLFGRNEIAFIWEDGFESVTDANVLTKHQLFKLKIDHENFQYDKFNRYPLSTEVPGSYGSRLLSGTAGDFNGDGLYEYVVINPHKADTFKMRIPYLDSLSHDSASVIFFKGPASDFENPGLGRILVERGNFDSDLAHEIVIAFVLDQKVILQIYDVNDSLGISYKSSFEGDSLKGYADIEPFNISVGELDGDEVSEIALVYRGQNPDKGNYLQIFNVIEDYEIQPEAVSLLSQSVDASIDNTVPGITIADIDGNDTNEVVIAWVFDRNIVSTRDTIYVLPVKVVDDPETTENKALEMIKFDTEQITRVPNYFNTYVSLVSGDVTGNGKDELFVGADYIMMLYHDTGLRMNVSSYADYGYGSTKYMDVTNIDGEGADEFVYGTVISYYNLRTYIVKFDEDGNEISTYSVEPQVNNPPHNFILLTGDFDADRFKIGPGVKYIRTDIVQPLVILNAPPTHFDVFGANLFDVNACYGDNVCNSYAKYTTTSSEETAVSATLSESWAVSARTEGGGSFFGAKVSAYVQAEYGEYFENSSSNNDKITITQTITASGDDLLYATVCDYEIWEYPILNENEVVVDNLITLKPLLKQNRWFPSKERSAEGYIPKHEVGNILSYTPFEELANNPDGAELIRGSYGDDSYELNESASYKYEVDFENTFNSSSAVQRNIGLEAGGSIGGWGIEVSAAGRYEKNTLSTHSVTVDKGIFVEVVLPNVDRSLGETNYRVTPYIYWSVNGALVVDYAASPALPAPGGTDTWWSDNYNIEDPTLVLPWKHDPEKGLTLQDQIRRKQTKSLLFSPRSPKENDTVTITATVHNFSPYPTAGKVSVSFYLGDPDFGGTLLTDIYGETIFKTDGVIAEQSFSKVNMRWEVPGGIPSFPRIFCVIDPNDEITEVHETNNVGWAVLGKTDYGTPVEDVEHYLFENGNYTFVYPNPANEYIQIYYIAQNNDIANIQLFDQHGRVVYKRQVTANYNEKNVVEMNLSEFSPGIYYYNVSTNDYSESGKILVR